MNRVGRENPAVVRRGECPAFVREKGVRETRNFFMRHLRKIAERVRVRKRAVLVEAFLRIAALDVVEAPRVAAVVAGKNAAFRIELDAKRVAAAFGKNLIAARFRMVAPDELTERIDSFLVVGAEAFDAPGDRA